MIRSEAIKSKNKNNTGKECVKAKNKWRENQTKEFPLKSSLSRAQQAVIKEHIKPQSRLRIRIRRNK